MSIESFYVLLQCGNESIQINKFYCMFSCFSVLLLYFCFFFTPHLTFSLFFAMYRNCCVFYFFYYYNTTMTTSEYNEWNCEQGKKKINKSGEFVCPNGTVKNTNCVMSVTVTYLFLPFCTRMRVYVLWNIACLWHINIVQQFDFSFCN